MLIPALLSCVVLGDVLVPGMAAPAFTADASIKGAEVKALAPGKVHVVEFWATWCGPCIGSMPHLTQLQKSNPDVTVIGEFTSGTTAAAGAATRAKAKANANLFMVINTPLLMHR